MELVNLTVGGSMHQPIQSSSYPSIDPGVGLAAPVRQRAAVAAVKPHPQDPIFTPLVSHCNGPSLVVVRSVAVGVGAAAAAFVIALPQVRLVVVEVELVGVERRTSSGIS